MFIRGLSRCAFRNRPPCLAGKFLLEIAATGGLSSGGDLCYSSESWPKPIDGGKPAAYKIQRRERPEGPWTDANMALESEITLSDQTRGTEWEFRVIAVNKAGDGVPSNTVMAVL